MIPNKQNIKQTPVNQIIHIIINKTDKQKNK